MSTVRNAFAAPHIAAKQRTIVMGELRDMRKGEPPVLFQVAGDALAEIAPTLPAPITLLDVGCGSAYYSEVTEYFTPNRYVYTGADYNPGMVALARKLYPSLTIHQADACCLKFGDRSFDVVFSGACIAHIPEWMVALSEIARVARFYLVLHRNPVWIDGTPTTFDFRGDYGAGIWVHRFNEQELLGHVLGDFNLVAAWNASRPTSRMVTRTYLLGRKT